MSNHKLSFSNFEKASAEEWENKIAQDLKGTSSQELGLEISEGQFLPIAVHIQQKMTSGVINRHRRFPLIGAAPISLDNASILHALMGGANAIRLDEALKGKQSWEDLLAKVDLSFLDVTLKGSLDYIDQFLRFSSVSKRPVLSGEGLGLPIEQELQLFQAHVKGNSGWRFFSCQTTGSETVAVGCVASFLQSANQRLIQLDAIGELSEGAKRFACRIAIGTNYMQTILTLRAVRLVWALLLDSWKLNAKTPLFIHCRAAIEAFDQADEEKNMIRSTSLAAAALVGGTDAIWLPPVNPSDSKGDFYKRIARNNLHLFEQEGKLGWVGDPVAGAKYFEHGTNLIAEQAWNLFRG